MPARQSSEYFTEQTILDKILKKSEMYGTFLCTCNVRVGYIVMRIFKAPVLFFLFFHGGGKGQGKVGGRRPLSMNTARQN